MQLLKTVAAVREFTQSEPGKALALVPTMGALHEGHLSLVRLAKENADRVMVSIFVNPLQFAPNEDLDRYPRMLEADLAACERLGVEAVFAPEVGEIYPSDSDVTRVHPPESLTDFLCGAYRPGHFDGVATVVLKLFDIVQPDIAVFGEKDAQQLAVIQRMVQDLNLPVRILAHPIVREASGLAMSSRNAYLRDAEERKAALSLITILKQVERLSRENPDKSIVFQQAQIAARQTLDGSCELFELQYLEAVDARTFQPVQELKPGVRVLIAGFVGPVRLIDNIVL